MPRPNEGSLELTATLTANAVTRTTIRPINTVLRASLNDWSSQGAALHRDRRARGSMRA
jgi:hypothetical protein